MVQLDGPSVMRLAEARDEYLERAPLKLVVCQARYPRKLAAVDLEVGLAVQRALGGADRWRLDEAQSQLILSLAVSQVQGGAPAATPLDTQPGWQLMADEGAWTVTILPQSVSLETTRYENWAHFSDRFSALLVAVQAAVHPGAEERLGLRYVNRIEEPRVESAGAWARWIRPEVLGIVLHPEIGAGVVATQQQVDVKANHGLRATLRHGVLREDNSVLSYIIDIDTYRTGVRPFDPESILEEAGRQNQLARQLFQSVVTDEMYAYLRGGTQ
jgi:uncharacterized protein (TIGR04255 family)